MRRLSGPCILGACMPLCRVGQTCIYTVYDRTFHGFPAKKNIYTVYIWFWPTLLCAHLYRAPACNTVPTQEQTARTPPSPAVNPKMHHTVSKHSVAFGGSCYTSAPTCCYTSAPTCCYTSAPTANTPPRQSARTSHLPSVNTKMG